jgi:hypothetical protein
MKVYKLRLASSGSFCIFANPEDIRYDLEIENTEYSDGMLDVEKAIEEIKALGVHKKWKSKIATVDCYEMSEQEYDMLPEFCGW